jgi:2-amino-4-hydroxy-6-hydroxymethyldihydropteridine diphosphokinase
MIDVYIGLGSNLDNPVSQIKQALKSLGLCPDLNIEAVSSFYGNPPMGPVDQPDYVNAVVKISTAMSAPNLLQFLQSIEQKQKRTKLIKWGPRTIDLDILLYGSQQINLPNLVIPHRGLTERVFVILPLLEIAPDLMLPNQVFLRKIAENFDSSLLIKLREENEHTYA